jgi:sn-glycerol 3-phosphate transport system ATP-binding protein
MAMISLDAVRKVYGGQFEAVKGVSLDIADGEFVVLVGPSGCGKSTLLRMIAGLESITEGGVSIGKRVVNDIDPAERDIAMVFQNYALYPHMSVYNNMAYGLRNRKTEKGEIDRRVREAARILELEPYLDRRPRALSGGQRQRVAMGRAIVRKPEVFLFDEPLSNLDAKLRVQMRVEIKTLQRRLGVTSIYVTHDQVEAMTMADRIIVMNGGAAEQVGTPLQVYQKPASVFVGSFIGSPPMNLLSVERLREAGLLAAVAEAADPARGAETVGVRPEHLVPCQEAQAVLSGEIVVAEALGAETLLHVALADGERVIARVAAHEEIPGQGTRIHLRCGLDDLHYFGTDGRRLAAA